MSVSATFLYTQKANKYQHLRCIWHITVESPANRLRDRARISSINSLVCCCLLVCFSVRVYVSMSVSDLIPWIIPILTLLPYFNWFSYGFYLYTLNFSHRISSFHFIRVCHQHHLVLFFAAAAITVQPNPLIHTHKLMMRSLPFSDKFIQSTPFELPGIHMTLSYSFHC